MKISEMKVAECMDDTELISAVAEITQKLVDKIFIAEDMNDAVRDGYDGGIHKVLSDGRVVWIDGNL
jgi:light-regulated signal transduction histidine kinase (bacteriophytochrome)